MRYHPLGHTIEQLLIAPLGLGDKVMQGLVPGAGAQGSTRAAMGSILLRDRGSIRPVQYPLNPA